MKKHYLVNQPPLADKYTFLVDDISEKVNYGLTTDIDKINYNRELMGEHFDHDVKIGLLMSESKGSTFVFDLGHFITVLELRADQQEGKMSFFDYIIDMPREDLRRILVERFSNRIADEWFKLQDKMLATLTPADDIVQLHKPDV